jgi:hypothetical protein
MNETPTIPQLHGRAGLIKYSKSGRTTTVDWEMLVGASPLILFATRTKCWDDGSLVTEEERAAIVEDIRMEIRAKGWGEIEVDDPRYLHL